MSSGGVIVRYGAPTPPVEKCRILNAARPATYGVGCRFSGGMVGNVINQLR